MGELIWFLLVGWLFGRRGREEKTASTPQFVITSMSQDEWVEMCLDMPVREPSQFEDPR